jgi:hypothetical protein
LIRFQIGIAALLSGLFCFAVSAKADHRASVVTIRSGVWVKWENSAGKFDTYAIGPIRVRGSKIGTGDLPPARLLINGPGKLRFQFVASEDSLLEAAAFGVGRIDPDGGQYQILVSTYTGGAHCCTQMDLLELRAGKWADVQVGLWDGDELGSFPADVDGDGIPDFVTRDNRFLYVFAGYAGSSQPPRVIDVRRGKARDVSFEKRYQSLFQRDLDTAMSGCLQHENSACAAFAADAARLNRFAWAWPIVLANYDHDVDGGSDWLYTRCDVKLLHGACPDGHETKSVDFPHSLTQFLVDTGYLSPPHRRVGHSKTFAPAWVNN